MEGLTLKQFSQTSPLSPGEMQPQIILLKGLPMVVAGATIAHELMHCWLFLQRFPELDEETEEGLSEVAAYTWLTDRINNPEVSKEETEVYI